MFLVGSDAKCLFHTFELETPDLKLMLEMLQAPDKLGFLVFEAIFDV